MTSETDINQVFDMAIQIERDAADFYRSAAENATFAEAGRALLDLAMMEDEHVLIFSAIKDRRLSDADGIEPTMDTSILASGISVAKVLASGIQEDLADRFSGWESSQQVLNLAIDFERDTIVFLSNMKQMLSIKSELQKVDEVILEEMGHIIKLSAQLAAMTLPETRDVQAWKGPPLFGQTGGDG